MILKIPSTRTLGANESSIGSSKTPVAEAKPKTTEKPVASEAKSITHVVEPKETLYSLSKNTE